MDRVDGKGKCNKKIRIDKIIRTEGVHGPNRTVWPEYRYHQVDESWMGLQFREVFQCQSDGTNIILTHPDMTTLRNTYGDGNCLFRAFSYIITGSENQHFEVCDVLLSYMLSIENLLVGHSEDGSYNYLQPFGHRTVQNYIDSGSMDRSGTWGSELEMMCLSHMLNTIVFSFGAPKNNWEVFGYNFIDRSLICDYVVQWFPFQSGNLCDGRRILKN